MTTSIEHRKQLDDLICDEVNAKALNRVLATDNEGRKIELQYVRSIRKYNWRVDGNWHRDADETTISDLLMNL